MPCYLGRDEQSAAPLFVRMWDPTDLQTVAWKMCDAIKRRLSWDWLNPQAWRMVGFDCGPVEQWLKDYIALSREQRVPLTDATRAQFAYDMVGQYGYDPDDIDIFIDEFLALKDQGLVPVSISKPWTYEPTSVREDITKEALTKVLPVAALIGLAALAVYGFTTRGLPRLVASKASSPFQ